MQSHEQMTCTHRFCGEQADVFRQKSNNTDVYLFNQFVQYQVAVNFTKFPLSRHGRINVSLKKQTEQEFQMLSLSLFIQGHM